MSAPDLSPNAVTVLEKRYLKRDATGRIVETPEDLLRRVAWTIAEADARVEPGTEAATLAQRFYELMASRRFFPNSPCLAAGRPKAQLAACFVLPVEDDLKSIYGAIEAAALIHQSGGGTGFDFSRLRPKGDLVATTGGSASGPVSFIRLFDTSTDVIKQGGIRRGANMGILRVDHPDILAFIGEKADPGRLNNFNVSVGVTDAFMQAVVTGDRYDLVNPHGGQVVRRLDARKVFQAVVNHAWESGEPGMIFLDHVNAANPTPHLGHIDATNPCGEQPLLPYESCILGSLNLARFVDGGAIDLEGLKAAARLAVRFLDDVIEANHYPLAEIAHVTRLTRKVGLGVMGLADLFIELAIPYDSEDALAVADRLMAAIGAEARAASAALARRRGPFPAWKGSRLEQQGLPPQRNATVTSIAPTGTLSILGGCSAGIEPLYAVTFVRHVLEGEDLLEVQPSVRAALEARELDADAILAEVRATGSLRDVPGIPEDLKRRFATAHDIDPAWHVRMQAAFQRHVDNAVSKTINLRREATPEDVADAYRLAFDLGCKGITVYREGSRRNQVYRAPGEPDTAESESVMACPDCGTPIAADERCLLCRACGWSACVNEASP